jgi:hypothetical protein
MSHLNHLVARERSADLMRAAERDRVARSALGSKGRVSFRAVLALIPFRSGAARRACTDNALN